MKSFVCVVLAAMVASSMATVLVGSNLGLGLGGVAPIGLGWGGVAPINNWGLGYNTVLNRGLITPGIVNRGLIAPGIINRGLVSPYGLGLNGLGLGLRANSLLLPQSRVISSPLIAPLASKTVLWK